MPISLASVHGWSNASRLTYLTFNRAVALPGVTLQAGTYAFDILNPESTANVVRVRNRERTKVFYVGLTRRIPRPESVRRDRPVQLGEAAAGVPAPILAWYHSDDRSGYEFQYR